MRVLIVLLLTGFANVVRAQSTPDEIIREFFGSFSEHKVEKAVTDLYGHSKWLSRDQDGLSKMKSQLVNLTDMVGAYYGYTLLASQEVATDLIIYDYFVKFERQPVRFRFEFYRPDKTWTVFAFSIDDTLDDDLEQAVKAKYYDH